MLSCRAPFGISDAAKINKNYKTLIEELDLNQISNLDVIQKLNNVWGNNQQSKLLMRYSILEENKMNPLDQYKLEKESKFEIEVIYLWRSSRLPISSIASKLKISKCFVSRTIAKYKALVRWQIKKNISQRNRERKVISQAKVDQINAFISSNSNKIIHIKDIKRNAWNNQINERTPCNSTISAVLHEKLRMSYKLLKNRHPKVFCSENRRLYFEAALIQSILEEYKYEIIFIDEFQISNKK